MKKVFISSMAVLAVLSVTSCKTDFETDVADIAVTSGEADFSKYVALGNSLTSGYRDGTVYLDGQLESYPAMIAKHVEELLLSLWCLITSVASLIYQGLKEN